MPDRPKSLPQQATELYELVVAYFKQETVAPLQSLARWILLGIAGSLLIGIGVMFLAVGILRTLQVATSAFTDDWTWVPYLIVVVLLALGGALTWMARGIGRERGA